VQLDWVTVTAQIVNFLILVWLLHRVLYRPLNRAIVARGQEVNRRLAEAEAAQRAAQAAEREHREAIRALEQKSEAILQAARDTAAALRRDLTGQVRAEIAARRAAWEAQLADEKAAFLDKLRRRAGQSFVALARRVLSEMADRDLVEQMARVFARRLAALGDDDAAPLKDALDRGEVPEVRASFPLSPDAQSTVAAAVAAVLGSASPAPRFVHAAEVEGGIVLVMGSRHVGWTIGEHLDAFEREVSDVLRAAEASAGLP
jgi:F-type H+-transporting ATPase subunit b